MKKHSHSTNVRNLVGIFYCIEGGGEEEEEEEEGEFPKFRKQQ